MQEIELLIEGDPVPKGRPRFRVRGKFVSTYTPAKTVKAEKVIAKAFEKIKPEWFQDAIDLKLPIEAEFIFGMPIPKSTSKKKAALMVDCYHVRRPDCDNLIKLVLDGLGVHFEDSLVARIKAKKIYAVSPFTQISLRL